MQNNKKFVLIEWLDSRGVTFEWEYIDEVKPLKPCKCSSVGFLLEDNEDYKTIVQTISEDQLIGRMSIPTRSIIRIKEIEGTLN